MQKGSVRGAHLHVADRGEKIVSPERNTAENDNITGTSVLKC
jgi:hypothetical protein